MASSLNNLYRYLLTHWSRTSCKISVFPAQSLNAEHGSDIALGDMTWFTRPTEQVVLVNMAPSGDGSL